MDLIRDMAAPLEHPSYIGHFPDRPVLPGVVLLDLITEAIGLGAPRAITSTKFHRALKPGDGFVLHWKIAGPSVSFRCERDAEMIAEGRLEFGAPR